MTLDFSRLSAHARARNNEHPGRRADTAARIALDIAKGCVDMRGFGAYTPAFLDCILRTAQKLHAQSTPKEAEAASRLASAQAWADHMRAVAQAWMHAHLTPMCQERAPGATVESFSPRTGVCTYTQPGRQTTALTLDPAALSSVQKHLHQKACRTFRSPTQRAIFCAMVDTCGISAQQSALPLLSVRASRA